MNARKNTGKWSGGAFVVLVGDHMLADVSGEEVEAWMIENGHLTPSDAAPDAPVDSSCTDEQHAAMEREAAAQQQPGRIRIIE